MIFDITGADSKTGAERTIRIRADDERQALALAKEHGIHAYSAQRDEAAEFIQAGKEANVALERAREEHALSVVQDVKSKMRERLQDGQAVYLYDTVYLPVDSILMDAPLSVGFDISQIRLLGIEGWEVMQVIPRTIGVGLTNNSIGSTMGTTWGGGAGGNVIGVYIVLKKSIKIEDVDDPSTKQVEQYIRSNLNSF